MCLRSGEIGIIGEAKFGDVGSGEDRNVADSVGNWGLFMVRLFMVRIDYIIGI